MKINSKHYHIFLNKGTWPLDWLIASRLWNSTPYITIWTIELQNYRSNTLIYVTDFSLNVLIPTLNSRLNLFIRFLSLSFHSKFNISVVNKLQDRHGWQGPEGIGLAWILHIRKQRHAADVDPPCSGLAYKKLAVAALSWDYFRKRYITSSSNMLIFPMQVDICDELPLFVCQASGFFPVK